MVKKIQSNITVVMLARNAQDTIERSLQSCAFAQEIVLVDDESTDKTVDIGLHFKARVIHIHGDFATKRTKVLKEVKTKWVLYLDADEVISEQLAEALLRATQTNEEGVFLVTRHNFFLGKRMYNDTVERLFSTNVLKGWRGKVHESPVITMDSVLLNGHMDHFTHRTIASMLEKTNEWSEIEARLRLDARHPRVAWWRLIRIGMTVLWQQLMGKGLWKYGREGWFEAYFQMIDKLIVYTKLWELQQTTTGPKTRTDH